MWASLQSCYWSGHWIVYPATMLPQIDSSFYSAYSQWTSIHNCDCQVIWSVFAVVPCGPSIEYLKECGHRWSLHLIWIHHNSSSRKHRIMKFLLAIAVLLLATGLSAQECTSEDTAKIDCGKDLSRLFANAIWSLYACMFPWQDILVSTRLDVRR